MSSQSPKDDKIPLESVHEISIKELASFREFQKLSEKASKSLLVSTVSTGTDIDTVHLIENELAKTISQIDIEIQKRMAAGKSCIDQNTRKIRALKNLSDLIFTKRQVALNEAINLKSESFEVVFKEILDLVRTSAEKAGVPNFHVDALFAELTKNLTHWEEQTQKKLIAQLKK